MAAKSRVAPSRCEVARVPSTPPPFTLADVRRAIPAHCFEKSLTRSLSYLALDVAVCAALWYAALWIDTPLVPRPLAWILWPLYWFWQVRATARGRACEALVRAEGVL